MSMTQQRDNERGESMVEEQTMERQITVQVRIEEEGEALDILYYGTVTLTREGDDWLARGRPIPCEGRGRTDKAAIGDLLANYARSIPSQALL